MSAIEDLAHALAQDVIDALEELDDDRFYDKVGKVVADGSPTLHEAFMTAIRVRLAERRARGFLDQALKTKRAAAAKPAAAAAPAAARPAPGRPAS